MTSMPRTSGLGQNHERFLYEDGPAIATTTASSPNGGSGDIPDITAGQRMISATSGSLLTSLLVTPLDVVRVRLQSQPATRPIIDFAKLSLPVSGLSPASTADLGVTYCCREVFFANNNNGGYCLAIPRPPGEIPFPASIAPHDCAVEEVQKARIGSTLDGLRKIARNEGITTLWRGLSPTLVMAIPANIIYLSGYDWLRTSSRSPLNKLVGDAYAPLLAGSFARVVAASCVSPIELFRTRLQASSGSSASGHVLQTFRGIQKMVRSDGYASLWRGLVLTLWRDVPFSGIYWWGYEVIRGKLTDIRERRSYREFDSPTSRTRARRQSQSHENHMDTFLDSFVAGAVSGSVASVLTMPFDVGKTRTQVLRDSSKEAAGAAARSAVPENQSMMRLLWHIFNTEGIQGLWKGWIPRTLKVAPACAIMISSYEVSKRVFRGVNERGRDDAREA